MKTEEWQEKAAFIDKLRELTDRLNRCRAAYEAHTPLVSDEVYDILFSDLQTLESWLGLRMKNSPTKKGNHLVLDSLQSIRFCRADWRPFSWLEIKMDKLELNNVIWYNSNKQIVGGILWHHRK